MPRNRIRLIETIHVTQKTDRTHHNSSSPLFGADPSACRGRGEVVCGGDEAREGRGVWGAVRCGLVVQQVAVYPIFILKTAQMR
jgi:hypothetical protein